MDGDQKDGLRGIALIVDKIIGYDWFRTRLRARAEFLGPDRASGDFAGIQLRINPARLGAFSVRQLVIRAQEGEPIYLVCYGKNWRVGDAIPIGEIVYRYEP